MKDYYEILGVNRDASQEEIKKKYRSIALKMHPDRLVEKSSAEKKEIEKKFQEITNAYEVLSNEESRRKYDSESSGYNGFNFDGFGNGSSAFEEIFESFFSRKETSSSRKNANSPRRGEDILLNITISFKEFVLGIEKSFSIDLLKSCPECLQSGAYSADHIKTCSSCNGRGIVDIVQRSLFGNVRTQSTCSSCSGKGKIISKKCDLCHGNKFVNRQESVTVRIPKGFRLDRRMVIKSSGNDGLYGLGKGDIFVDVKVREHRYFKKKNDDIYVELPISFIDSVLGNEVEVITIEGVESVKIPQGSQNGDYITMKNRGFYKKIGEQSRGDLYILLQIKMPKKISRETQSIFSKLQEGTSWNPNKDFLEKNKDILSEQ